MGTLRRLGTLGASRRTSASHFGNCRDDCTVVHRSGGGPNEGQYRPRVVCENLQAICRVTPSKSGQGLPLDPKTLARIEHEFTQPSVRTDDHGRRACSARRPSHQRSDALPRCRWPRRCIHATWRALTMLRSRSSRQRADQTAQETLRRLYRGGALSPPAQLSAAIWLASRFHDDSGLPLMTPRLRSRQAQVRADTLSYMGYVLTERGCVRCASAGERQGRLCLGASRACLEHEPAVQTSGSSGASSKAPGIRRRRRSSHRIRTDVGWRHVRRIIRQRVSSWVHGSGRRGESSPVCFLVQRPVQGRTSPRA